MIVGEEMRGNWPEELGRLGDMLELVLQVGALCRQVVLNLGTVSNGALMVMMAIVPKQTIILPHVTLAMLEAEGQWVEGERESDASGSGEMEVITLDS